MITQFSVQNYKSIKNLSINLGRINVLIGENGCGKSNILEAFVLASATSENKLDNEFLSSRGLRVTKPELMRSAFNIENTNNPISLEYKSSPNLNEIKYNLINDNLPYSKWEKQSISHDNNESRATRLARKIIEEEPETAKKILENNSLFTNKEKKKDEDILIDFFKKVITELEESSFKNFIIYSPENTSLRTFEKEGQIEPLGIYGEGLFKLLKFFKSDEKEKLETIKKHLNLFGWFEDLTIPDNLFEGESYLKIKDKFIDEKIDFFDQRSSNEGFLFILFYCSLLISKKTPDFFAIDNIESSLNPKLTTKLIKCLTELSKENNKQIILTTHSPSVLDGLDLNDPEQKLFLVYRNNKGYTTLKEIEKPKQIDGQEPIKLSEAFLRGYLGGLPKNFSL